MSPLGHLWGLSFLHIFVCDTQMLLPEGIRRENNKMYEEVEIPPNEPMAVGFEEKPVYISELDEVGAIVFSCFCVCGYACVFVWYGQITVLFWRQIVTFLKSVWVSQWTYPYRLCWQSVFSKRIITTVAICKHSVSFPFLCLLGSFISLSNCYTVQKPMRYNCCSNQKWPLELKVKEKGRDILESCVHATLGDTGTPQQNIFYKLVLNQTLFVHGRTLIFYNATMIVPWFLSWENV